MIDIFLNVSQIQEYEIWDRNCIYFVSKVNLS